MLKQHFWKIAALVIVLAIGGSIVYSQQVTKQANVGVVVEPHHRGNPDAAVKLVEYSDFQCPACGQFEPYVEKIMDEYGDQIDFEYRHFPLLTIHQYALPAAIAAEAAAQQGKFWEMHDKLFAEQSVWSKSSTPSAYFEQYAKDLGLDVSLFKTHLQSSIISDAIKDSFNEARSRELTGTPTFFLNGEKMTYENFGDFENAIKAAVEGTSTAATSQ